MRNPSLAALAAVIASSQPTATVYAVTVTSPAGGAVLAMEATAISVSVAPAVPAETALAVTDTTTGTAWVGTVGAGVSVPALAAGAHSFVASIYVEGQTFTSSAVNVTVAAPAATLISGVSAGASFAPVAYTDGTETELLWTFEDGTTSTAAIPNAYTGAAGDWTLRVVPSTALRGLNFGFYSDDGGDAYNGGARDLVADQGTDFQRAATNLASIAGLQSAPNLVRFLACRLQGGPTALDFSGLTHLRTIECYSHDGNQLLASVDLSGCSSLVRVCFENCRLLTLDLSAADAFEDLRGRYQRHSSAFTITSPQNLNAWWHCCVGDQPGTVVGLDAYSDGTITMPAMVEWWVWGARLTGPLAPVCPNGTIYNLYAYGCSHTSLDTTGIVWRAESAIDLHGNSLGSGSLVITEATAAAVRNVNLQNCGLTQAQVDHVLEVYATHSTFDWGTITLDGNNSHPSATGQAHRATIEARGMDVVANASLTTAALEVGRTLYGTDNTSRPDAPSEGTLACMWTRIPTRDFTVPWERGNMDVFVLRGVGWALRCLVGNCGVGVDGNARLNANTMLGASDGTWLGDYAYYQGLEHTPAQVMGWVWVAWQTVVNSDSFTIRQWLKLGPDGDVFEAGESTVTFAAARAFGMTMGWTQQQADAWVPGDTTGFNVGSDNAHLCYARIYDRADKPSLSELDAVASSVTADALAWADYVLVWGDTAPDLTDRSGNGRALVLGDGGTLYAGFDVPNLSDVVAPALSNLVVDVSATTATISWTTPEPATSTVRWGATASYGSIEVSAALVREHLVVLEGLTPATMLHYNVSSTDGAGNTATSADATFTTYSDSGETGLHATTVEVIGTNRIRATYTWATADELLDWTPTAGTTLALGTGTVSTTGGTSAMHGIRWNQPIAASLVSIAGATAVTGTSLRIYTDLLPSWNEGTEASPLLGHVWNQVTPFFKPWPAPGSNQVTDFPAIVNGTPYDLRFEVSTTLMSAWSSANNATRTFGWTFAPSTSGTVALVGGGNNTFGTVVVEGEIVPSGGGGGTAPVISGISYEVTGTTATVTFATDVPATSVCEFGPDATYGRGNIGSSDTLHSLTLAGLESDTLYHFRVHAVSATGIASSSVDYVLRTEHASAYPALNIVVLGASTAQGVGASDAAHSWAGLLASYVEGLSAAGTVTNIAFDGLGTYGMLPTGTTPPEGRPAPNVDHNITAALALNPDIIVWGPGSNDIVYDYSTAEIHANYAAIIAAAEAAGVTIWVTTVTPRNVDAYAREGLVALRDWVTTTYPTRVIDAWTTLANEDGTFVEAYNADDTHPNDAGHLVIYSRVQSSSVLDVI